MACVWPGALANQSARPYHEGMIRGVCSENAISITTDLSLWRSRYRVSLIKMKSEGQGFDPPRRHFLRLELSYCIMFLLLTTFWNDHLSAVGDGCG